MKRAAHSVLFPLILLTLSMLLPNAFANVPRAAHVASYSTNLPMIDGSLTDPEWNDANSYDIDLYEHITPYTITGTVYFKHDGTNIYIGIKVNDWTGMYNEFSIFFDERDDGGYGSGTRDGVLTSNQEDVKSCGLSVFPYYSHEILDGYYKQGSWERSCGGDFNARMIVGHLQECEFSIPFFGNDGAVDDVSDLVCSISDTIGIKIRYLECDAATPTFNYPAGSANDIQTYATLSFAPIPVIPEVPLGTIMTSTAMIIALGGFVGFKRYRPKFRL